ncbi:uncharacterized protein METZ01_LOCUS471326, partial [marine metagenome]
VLPLIAGVAREDGQAALLQADGDALTGLHVVELHLDVGPETEGGYHGTEARFAVDVKIRTPKVRLSEVRPRELRT